MVREWPHVRSPGEAPPGTASVPAGAPLGTGQASTGSGDSHRAPRPWARQERAAWVVLATSLLITFAAWQVTHQYVNEQIQKRFELDTEEVRARILARMNAYQQILLGGVAFIDSLQQLPSRAQWRQYVSSLELSRHYPGIQGFGFSLMLSASERAAHEAAVRAEGFPDYHIRPAGARDPLSSIIYLEPFKERNLRAFGYDMYSEPVRREAMAQARDSGQPTLSGRVTLVQETEEDVQHGFLMYLPVYRAGQPRATLDARRQALLGFVYSPFRVRDLLVGILGTIQRDVVYQLYDGELTAPSRLLYDSSQAEPLLETRPGTLSRVARLQLPGRLWTIHFSASQRYAQKVASLPTIQILIAGLTVNLLLVYFFVQLSWQRRTLLTQTTQLEQSDRELKRAQHIAHLGSWSLNRQTGELVGSRELLAILELSPEEPLNLQQLRKRWHPEDLPILEHGWSRALKGEAIDLESRLLINNSVRWVWVHAEPVISELPDAPARGTLQDITELKDVKLELWRNNERIRLIAETVAGYASFQLDIQGKVVSWNPNAEALTGFSEQEILGQPLEICLQLEEGTSLSTQRRLYRAATQGRQVVEGWLTRRDGQRYFADTILAALTDESQRLLGFIQLIRDVTERRQMEEELAQARDRANAANEAKSLFLANMSHEVRTPMNAILGLTRLAISRLEQAPGERGPLHAQLLLLLNRSLSASKSLLLILNEILDFTKIESGKLELEAVPIPLSPMLDQLLSLFQGLSSEQGLLLELERAPTTPPWILGDRLRLEQILSNLLSNALKFTERGRVCLKVGPDPVEPQRLLFVIEDTGIGISPDRMDKIFHAFSQADSSMTRRYGGTGLGLAICLRLTRLMGGELAVESEPGRGSRFVLSLPIRLPETAGLENISPEPPSWESAALSARSDSLDSGVFRLEPSGQTLEPREGLGREDRSTAEARAARPISQPLQGVQVLVVEDNEINAEIVREQLHHWGAAVRVASNGARAIESVQASPPELVLMDLQMPEMDGFEATRRIRALPGFKALPIVALSASALLEEQQACLQAGMDAHLSKPLELDVFLETVLRLLKPIRALEGFDLRKALERLSNNQALLDRLLKDFLGLCRSTRGQLEEQGDMLEPSALRALVHRVRGPALNLGAQALAEEAQVLEQAVRQGLREGIPAFLAHLGRIEAVLGRSLEEESADEDALAPSSALEPPLSGSAQWARLTQLKQELQAHRPPDPKVLAPLWEALKTQQQGSIVTRLAGQLNRFEFAAALQTIAALEDALRSAPQAQSRSERLQIADAKEPP